MLITFPRYILRELGKAFGISLLVYTFVFLAMYSAQALSEGATLLTTFSLMPKLFPLISPLALPLAVITGILICYGRLSANNEFVGSQASGIHPIWVALPALAVAGLSSLVTVYLNDEVLTSSVAGIERSLLADRTEIIRSRLTKPGSFVFPVSDAQSFAICRLPSAWDSAGRSGVDFTVFKKAAPGTDPGQGWDPEYPYPESRILAKHHEIKVFEDEEGTMYLQSRFADASEYTFSSDTLYVSDSPQVSKSVVIPKSGMNFTINKDRTQYMGIDRLRLERKNLEQKQIADQQTLAATGGEALTGLAGLLTAAAPANELQQAAAEAAQSRDLQRMGDTVKKLADECGQRRLAVPAKLQRLIADFSEGVVRLRDTATEELRFTAEINVKLVMSFACISFAMIGIPVGLIARRGGSVIGFAVGLGFAFAFYMVITALHGAVRDGSLAWWGLWMPDLLVLGMGIFLWFRSIRRMC